jgi:hypothetical protein
VLFFELFPFLLMVAGAIIAAFLFAMNRQSED